MNMARHDTPSIYFEAFFPLAMFPAIEHDLFILVSYKQIYPVDNRKTYEIKLILVSEFIPGTHANQDTGK